MVSEITIALDLDSVLADVMQTWIEEYNSLYHKNIKKQDISNWYIHEVLDISEKCIHDLFITVWKKRWKDIPLTSKNVPSVISRLQEMGFRISIITKRERITMPFVSYWLDYYNIPFDDIIFIFDDSSKSHYPFFLLVDDSPINAKDIQDPKRIIIFDQPWNRFIFNYPRISKLDELVNLL